MGEAAWKRPAARHRIGPHRARAVELPEYLPARMLNELVYCPRLFFYEWVEGVFAHSSDTVEGSLRHEKLERKSDPLPPPREEAQVHSRSVMLSSETHGLIAKMDLVEGESGLVSPVDYKKGRPRDGEEGAEAWPADRVQLCAQALILRDNGYRCEEAVVYYDATRQRVRIPIDDGIIRETLQAVERGRALARGGTIPPPLIDSPKCPRCSLVGICLPDETQLTSEIRSAQDGQLSLFGGDGSGLVEGVDAEAEPPVRRLVPARDDLRPLYVAGHGVIVGKERGVLKIRTRDRKIQEARVNEISHVSVFGNVQLTSSAVRGLCEVDKPIAHFSFGGWFYGLTRGLGLKNVFLRREQFAKAESEAFCLRLSQSFVASKIRNQRTMLQRNHVEAPKPTLVALKRLASRAFDTGSLDELLGVEGYAARLYFEAFPGMLKANDTEESPDAGPWFDFESRNRRPPRDPVNALLSFAYSVLTKDLTITCHAVGFDPFVGFFHQPRFGRPALALDLMEGFRPLIADSAVLSAINTRMVDAASFHRVGDAVAMTPTGRKAFLRAYEQRMDALVTHPVFGYRLSYRRVLEVQARLLARVLTGEIREYPGFETR